MPAIVKKSNDFLVLLLAMEVKKSSALKEMVTRTLVTDNFENFFHK